MWLLLNDAKHAGISAEEIIGTLWWQLKSLRLVAQTSGADEAGLKPFVYKKAQQALGRYNESQLFTLSESLLRLYHDGHNGQTDIDLALERWVLTV